jgi:hypothetical protein
MTVTSPALAQSYNPADGTGNVLPFSFGPGGAKQRWTVVAPRTLGLLLAKAGCTPLPNPFIQTGEARHLRPGGGLDTNNLAVWPARTYRI